MSWMDKFNLVWRNPNKFARYYLEKLFKNYSYEKFVNKLTNPEIKNNSEEIRKCKCSFAVLPF